jgi:ATP-binding cassette, subfamily B (MDR/TAP), member 1
MILGTVFTIRMIRKYTIEEFKTYGVAGAIAYEALSSIRTVLSLGLQKTYAQRYATNLTLSESMAIKKGLLVGIFGGLSTGIYNLFFGIGIYYGVSLYQNDCVSYSVSNIVKSFFSVVTGTLSLGQALPFLTDIAEARAVAKKVFNLIDTKSEIDVFNKEQKSGIILENLQGAVEFENVYFHYPQRPEAKVLKGLSLKIPAGKTVALVGTR